MDVRLRRAGVLAAVTALLVAGLAVAPAGAHRSPPDAPDRARYILPPGNYGGLPTTDDSLDQMPLYDALTPLRGNVSDADIDANYLPENLEPVGATREEPTGRPGVKILYDEYGVPHISGKSRADLAFGAGWVTARDRSLLLTLGRGPARVAVADVPGINAFGLVTSAQQFVPSAATEQLLTDQVKLIIDTYGWKGWEIVADLSAEAEGINAYNEFANLGQPPATINDLVAVAAFIGSIFGAGGGAEASNAEFLSQLEQQLGAERGRAAWEDALRFDDPEAPTTTRRRFDYGPLTGGPVTGSAKIDAGSIVSFDPREGPTPMAAPAAAPIAVPVAATGTARSAGTDVDVAYPAAGPPPRQQASNFLVVNPSRSASGRSLAVMGPQLGYYYPEIVQQVHLSGPGIEAQGVGVPALMMYILIGRTPNYAWSLTSAGHDVQDVFVEKLCNPDGSAPTRQSDHYVFQGACRPFEVFDAGLLNGQPIVYPKSVHGSVIGTATSDGEPVALTRQRSTFGKDGLNLAALKDMSEGKADTPERFWRAANQFGFTFNWAYASRDDTAYFSSGLLPKRAPGLDRRLPTWGTGEYEWRGFLDGREHPHDTGGPDGLFLNWNNQSAPGFMHGDDEMYGSVHRVELFDQFPDRVTLADDVSVMNRAATEDTHSVVWPVVSELLHRGDAPSPLAAQVVDILDDWVRRDAPTLDADNSGEYDEPGPTVMNALWTPIAQAVMRPVFGDLTGRLSLGGDLGQSYVDKDLRTLLGHDVRGEYRLRYCGNGSLDECRASLWAVVEQVANDLATEHGPDPAAWRSEARRQGFTPGLIPDTIRATNRPTFQQVLEFARSRPDRPHDHDDHDHHHHHSRDHRRHDHHGWRGRSR
jgi:acyl-homoserine lactone acylase PvdQ